MRIIVSEITYEYNQVIFVNILYLHGNNIKINIKIFDIKVSKY